ncbi:MAG: hypothetical protein DDT32_01844 [Syntrophomonadaceae bacterium]|nr:hypothetical protein [Bacillota bacterium]
MLSFPSSKEIILVLNLSISFSKSSFLTLICSWWFDRIKLLISCKIALVSFGSVASASLSISFLKSSFLTLIRSWWLDNKIKLLISCKIALVSFGSVFSASILSKLVPPGFSDFTFIFFSSGMPSLALINLSYTPSLSFSII